MPDLKDGATVWYWNAKLPIFRHNKGDRKQFPFGALLNVPKCSIICGRKNKINGSPCPAASLLSSGSTYWFLPSSSSCSQLLSLHLFLLCNSLSPCSFTRQLPVMSFDTDSHILSFRFGYFLVTCLRVHWPFPLCRHLSRHLIRSYILSSCISFLGSTLGLFYSLQRWILPSSDIIYLFLRKERTRSREREGEGEEVGRKGEGRRKAKLTLEAWTSKNEGLGNSDKPSLRRVSKFGLKWNSFFEAFENQ